METFTDMAIASPQASRGKNVARQLEFRQLLLADAQPFFEDGQLEAFVVRHVGRSGVAGALSLHVFSTESCCVPLKTATQWINDDAATVRQ
jgi:hypothetical protein